jgi:hypothetical protein
MSCVCVSVCVWGGVDFFFFVMERNIRCDLFFREIFLSPPLA